MSCNCNVVSVEFKKLYDDVTVPQKAHEGDACFDLVAHNFRGTSPFSINLLPGERVMIGCGFSIATPNGWEAQVRSRSGLAVKNGVFVLNSPGTIDTPEYRGEICVVLHNLGNLPFSIENGMRIAQMKLSRVPRVRFNEVDELTDTARSSGGFGSTGV